LKLRVLSDVFSYVKEGEKGNKITGFGENKLLRVLKEGKNVKKESL